MSTTKFAATLAGGLVAGVILASLAAPASADPDVIDLTDSTISGPDIEYLLRTNLEVVPGSGMDPRQIRCPATREYRDGEVARCS
ncbi:hypothetical protein, partial [Mycolicibacterium thermoresistibile]